MQIEVTSVLKFLLPAALAEPHADVLECRDLLECRHGKCRAPRLVIPWQGKWRGLGSLCDGERRHRRRFQEITPCDGHVHTSLPLFRAFSRLFVAILTTLPNTTPRSTAGATSAVTGPSPARRT